MNSVSISFFALLMSSTLHLFMLTGMPSDLSAGETVLPKEIASAVLTEIEGRDVIVSIERPNNATLVVSHDCREFTVHRVDHGLEVSEAARIVVGPSAKGFRVTLEWESVQDAERGRQNSMGFINLGYQHEPYWRKYIGKYVVANEAGDGELSLTYEHGSQVEPDLLVKLCKALHRFGSAKLIGPEQGWETFGDDLVTKLSKCTSGLDSAPKWERAGSELVCDYLAQVDVYAIDADGVVADEVTKMKVPQRGGFSVRISQCDAIASRGLERLPYYTHYYQVYQGGFRIDIYGDLTYSRVHKDIFHQILFQLRRWEFPKDDVPMSF